MPVLPALYSGVPTVSVDGVSNALLESSVTSMIIEDANDGLATCEIAFQNAGATDAGVGFPLIDEQLIDFGSELRLEAGGGDAYGSIFDGTVTGLEVGFHQHDTARLTVLGADRFQELRRRRHTRVFEDMTDAEIIGVVGREHGLTVDVVGGDVEHRALAQFDQSDLAFIRERARRIGAEVALDGDRLVVEPRSARRSTPITCSFRQNLRDVDLSADLAGLSTEVGLTGWDPSTKQEIDVTSTGSVLAAERSPDTTAGFELLLQISGSVVDRVVHTVPMAVDEAQAIADARFRRQARRFVTGRVLLDGDARITVGGTVDLTGVGPWHTGSYDVTGVRHLFDLEQGFRTIAELERSELTR